MASEFYWMRYLFGLAVLDGDIRRESWLGIDKWSRNVSVQNINGLCCRVLRGCPGTTIYVAEIASLGTPFREALFHRRDPRQKALDLIAKVFQHMQLLGLGRCMPDPAAPGKLVFQKKHLSALKKQALAYVKKHHIPRFLFLPRIQFRCSSSCTTVERREWRIVRRRRGQSCRAWECCSPSCRPCSTTKCKL